MAARRRRSAAGAVTVRGVSASSLRDSTCRCVSGGAKARTMRPCAEACAGSRAPHRLAMRREAQHDRLVREVAQPRHIGLGEAPEVELLGRRLAEIEQLAAEAVALRGAVLLDEAEMAQ